jgi:DNA (cytosine-5)-methyltransferase 1
VREYARVQTFPDGWEFQGSVSNQYKQIGNAVPVNLGYHLGRAAISMIEGKFDAQTQEVLPPVPSEAVALEPTTATVAK